MSDSSNMDITGVKIAVVDDAATIRKLMSHRLELMGCEVRVAQSGYKALSLLRQFTPDIIFLDISMPELDGYQTCSLIRNSEATAHIPVILLSSQDGIFDIAEGSARGATHHVTKIPKDELLKAIIYKYVKEEKAA